MPMSRMAAFFVPKLRTLADQERSRLLDSAYKDAFENEFRLVVLIFSIWFAFLVLSLLLFSVLPVVLFGSVFYFVPGVPVTVICAIYLLHALKALVLKSRIEDLVTKRHVRV